MLVLVLVFTLLLVGSIATFLRRAVIDSTIVANRDALSRAEALCRGGVRLALALLLEDRVRELNSGLRVESRNDVWARLEQAQLPVADDARLVVRVEDAGARLNLNALFAEGALREPISELYLEEILEKAIREMPGRPEDKLYDAADLARNLIDWIDADGTAVRGGYEDDYYQRQDPPYTAANRPLLSLGELRLVEGFDGPLVTALSPYLTVHPYAAATGINPNTAPPYVLAAIYLGVADDFRMADEGTVASVLRVRESGAVLCAETADNPACTSIQEALAGQSAHPPLGYVSDVFHITAEAEVAGIRRSLDAVIDRTDVQEPLVLAWRVH